MDRVIHLLCIDRLYQRSRFFLFQFAIFAAGFTDLAEKYTKAGVGGPSKLSEILNSYIGAMVQEILSHNGDVLKFSGDAFIVMWKLEKDMFMRDIALEAIHTACLIQKHFGTYDTEVGVTLRGTFQVGLWDFLEILTKPQKNNI